MSVTENISASQIRSYYSVRVPQLKWRGKQARCWCPIHAKATRDSFSVETATGRCTCWSCGFQGDIVDLEQALTGLDKGAATRSVEALVGLASEWEPTPYAPRAYDPDPDKLAQWKANGKPNGAGKANGNGNGHHGKLAAVYPYLDEKWKLLYEVVRFEPKAFAQRRPDPEDASKRVWNLDGARRVIFNLPQVIAAEAVCIVEGEKDALALGEIGLVATTAPGGAKKWRAEYDQWFAGKTVYIIPDSDEPGREHARIVASHLAGIAKETRVVELPVHDVSDYLEMYSAEHLAELMANAPAWAPPPETQGDGPPWIPRGGVGRKPLEMANSVMASRSLLIHYGRLHEYDGRVWAERDDKILESYALVEDHPSSVSSRRCSETANIVRSTLRRQAMPEWRNLKAEEIAFDNGVLDIGSMRLRPHRKEDYLEAVVPHEYAPGKHCDLWLRSLRDWFGEGKQADEKIAALQEFMGYCLMAHALYKRALFLYGAPDTGKSVVEHVMQKLVGEGNYVHIPPDAMGDPRKIAPIKGKYINTVSELTADAMVDDAGFKRLVSTGDAVQLDRKYMEPESYKPFCKHIVVTNTLPRINDFTMATYNRLLVLSFDRIVTESARDPKLEAKLTAELPGILCWAVLGAARLASNEGRFTEPSDSRRVVTQHRHYQNPINDFLQEYCSLGDEEEFITLADIRRRYKDYQGAGAVRTNDIRRMLGNGRDQRYKLDAELLKLYGWRWKELLPGR